MFTIMTINYIPYKRPFKPICGPFQLRLHGGSGAGLIPLVLRINACAGSSKVFEELSYLTKKKKKKQFSG